MKLTEKEKILKDHDTEIYLLEKMFGWSEERAKEISAETDRRLAEIDSEVIR